MTTIDASALLRPGLLEGVSVLLAGEPVAATAEPADSLGNAVRAACAGLGAHVVECRSISARSADAEEAMDEAVEAALAEAGSIDLLAVDCADLFARGAGGRRDGREALRACLDAAWNVTRAVANLAFLPDEQGGRIVYFAPAAAAGEHADAARVGLENLSRTLSIEWARHAITVVTVAPGAGTSAGEVAALTAYLASPAGAYFSGCLLDLRGAAGD
jgi:NAD(P)-dependent dehydrogenase (short-subunit alcohol dehydrogenase family)